MNKFFSRFVLLCITNQTFILTFFLLLAKIDFFTSQNLLKFNFFSCFFFNFFGAKILKSQKNMVIPSQRHVFYFILYIPYFYKFDKILPKKLDIKSIQYFSSLVNLDAADSTIINACGPG